MVNCLPRQFFGRGAVEANDVGAIAPEANPAIAQGVIGTRRNHRAIPGMFPFWILQHLENRKFSCWRFPALFPHGDGITLKNGVTFEAGTAEPEQPTVPVILSCLKRQPPELRLMYKPGLIPAVFGLK